MTDCVLDMARDSQRASRTMATLSADVKNHALRSMAAAISSHSTTLIQANSEDLAAARSAGRNDALLDRLALSSARIEDMANSLRAIADLADPVGEVVSGSRRPNGLEVIKVRTPLGVVAVIYESRPNVTADAAGLCLKAGNAVLLRGGSESIRSNCAIADTMSEAGLAAGLPPGALQLIDTADRGATRTLMTAHGLVDLLIPRGGERLKQLVAENATVPVLASAGGNCHTFIDASANLDMAIAIALNAKVSRPSVCNAMETLLVHSAIADELLPGLCNLFTQSGVEVRGCERTRAIVTSANAATEQDWETEYLQLILAIRIVDSLEDALEHIAKYGTGHSEAIVTSDFANQRRFTQSVDAACVYVNASTRFTDGSEFGMGAEVGISTQKLHARGPIGLAELTTYKTIVTGDGQIRA